MSKNVLWEWNCTLSIDQEKLSTQSSTEATLVGTSEYVPFNFWMVMLMGAKGYAVKEKSYSRIIKA